MYILLMMFVLRSPFRQALSVHLNHQVFLVHPHDQHQNFFLSWPHSVLLALNSFAVNFAVHVELSGDEPIAKQISVTVHRRKEELIWLFFFNENFNKVTQKITLTQQHALTVICIVFLPAWQTLFRYNGLWELLFSPRSITSGVAFADTCTLAGQFVFICRSSWWKHFNWISKSDLYVV